MRKPPLRIQPNRPNFSYYKPVGRARRRPDRLTDEQHSTIEKYLHLVRKVLRTRPEIFDEEEAAQIASEAMCVWSPRWDAELGPIEPYLVAKMRFALIDAARTAGFIRRRLRDADAGIPLKFIWRPCSLDKLMNSGPVAKQRHEPADPESMLARRSRTEWFEAFYEIVDAMKPNSRTIIRGLLAGRTMKQIGADIGVCESRVSTMVPDILAHLGHKLERSELAGGP